MHTLITIIFRFNVRLAPTSSLLVEISEDLMRTMKNYLMPFNTWSLTGVVLINKGRKLKTILMQIEL